MFVSKQLRIGYHTIKLVNSCWRLERSEWDSRIAAYRFATEPVVKLDVVFVSFWLGPRSDRLLASIVEKGKELKRRNTIADCPQVSNG